MNCKHKPVDPTMCGFSRRKWFFLKTDGNTCRVCSRKIKIKHRVVSKIIATVLLVFLISPIIPLTVLSVLFPQLDSLLLFAIFFAVVIVAVLYFRFGGLLYSWEVDWANHQLGINQSAKGVYYSEIETINQKVQSGDGIQSRDGSLIDN